MNPGGTRTILAPPNYANSPLPTVVGGVVTPGTGVRKFVDTLPLLGPAGINDLGQYLPVAVADTTTYPGSDYYEIAVIQYTQRLSLDLPATTFRGYVEISTGVVPGKHLALTYPNGSAILDNEGNPVYAVDNPQYLGNIIVATAITPLMRRVRPCQADW